MSSSPAASSSGKGKDFSRMTAPTPTAANVGIESPGTKGKDLSRMISSPSQSSSMPTETTPTSKPKGKDFSRMVGSASMDSPSSQQAAATAANTSTTPRPMSQRLTSLSNTPSVPESEQQRRQSIARAAAGFPDNHTQQLLPTTAPSWKEASLSSEVPNATTTGKHTGDASKSPHMIGTKLQTICQSIDPSYTLEDQVQEVLLEMADDFVTKVTQDALKLAKHRGSKQLDVMDMALALKKGYGMEVPGFNSGGGKDHSKKPRFK